MCDVIRSVRSYPAEYYFAAEQASVCLPIPRLLSASPVPRLPSFVSRLPSAGPGLRSLGRAGPPASPAPSGGSAPPPSLPPPSSDNDNEVGSGVLGRPSPRLGFGSDDGRLVRCRKWRGGLARLTRAALLTTVEVPVLSQGSTYAFYKASFIKYLINEK